jgi:hypothetical protein
MAVTTRGGVVNVAMHDATVNVPPVVNEPILAYAAGSPERTRLQAASGC